MQPSHELLEHTAEVKLRVTGATLGNLLAEAGRAWAGIQLGGHAGTPKGD